MALSPRLVLVLVYCLLQHCPPSVALRNLRSSRAPLTHISPPTYVFTHSKDEVSGISQRNGDSRVLLGSSGFPVQCDDAIDHLQPVGAHPPRPVLFVKGTGSRTAPQLHKNPRSRKPSIALNARGQKGTPNGDQPTLKKSSAASAMRLEVLRKAKEAEEMKSAFPVALRVCHPELIAGKERMHLINSYALQL